jgi:dTDP-4-dehydrorhamnose 3,5-epimerase
MRVEFLHITGPFALAAPCHGEMRFHLTEAFNLAQLQQQGLVEDNWVQDIQSQTVEMHAWSGMDFQHPPIAQAKILRVITGGIFDVAVDLRPQSPTHGKLIAVELSSNWGNRLYVPTGFAHGFITLQPYTVVADMDSYIYCKTHDRSLNGADTDVAFAKAGNACAFRQRPRHAHA